jgi:RNA-directed DNA polymerase
VTGDAQAGSRSAFIVLLTAGNRAHWDPREGGEAPWDENRCQETREETLGSTNLSTKRQRIAELARTKARTALSTLHQVIDLEWMREAYQLTRKDGAPGIDGVTAADYEVNLEAKLLDLLERIKSGRYIAPPVRRVYIPKTDGSQRPLGIPTFEDKVAQRAIVMVLEAIYEQDFLSCSFGFRPGRSAHQALSALRLAFMGRKGLRWVLDVDISKYYDTIQHHHLRAFLDRRVTDGVIRRMIDKWLKAGVLEHDLLRHTTEGTPQGGVVSPVLANIYLHHVLDEWFEMDVQPRLKGSSILVRYADDSVMAFEVLEDAKRVIDVLGKRLQRYGLKLHPDKTRLVDFRIYRPGACHPDTGGTTFDFLGFSHIWAKTQKGLNGVRQVTAKSRYARALAAVGEWCRHNRHLSLREQHAHLSQMMRGHYAYYGISGNSRRIRWFACQVVVVWRKWLSRRDRQGVFRWDRLNAILKRHPLPPARIVHHLYATASKALP